MIDDVEMAKRLLNIGVTDYMVTAYANRLVCRCSLKDGTYKYLVNPSDWLIGQIYHGILIQKEGK